MISKLIFRAFVIGSFSLLLATSIFISIKPDTENYFYASLEKTRLLQETPSPRIILFGGSNIAFGIDSEMMAQELGIPVINDGLHAGLGIIPLNEIRDYIRQGDIIILSLESHTFLYRSKALWEAI